MPSIGEILARNARRVPNRIALVFGDSRYTYRQLDESVNQTAHAILRFSVRKGDRVALMAFNSDHFVFAYYALLKLGAIVVPINVRLAPPEVAYQLTDSGARLILHAPELTEVVQAALLKMEASWQAPPTLSDPGVQSDPAAPVGPVQALCLSNNQHPNLVDLMKHEPVASPSSASKVFEDDDAQILYTSGTTGKPKGVLFDHHRIIWTGLNAITSVSLREGERLLHVAPLYHSAELDLFLMAGTYLAGTHVVLREFHPATVLKTMAEEHITAFFGVPTMYQFMLRDPEFAQVDLSHWRIGMFGAAPMPPSTVIALSNTLPQVALYNLAGLTEMGPGGVFLGGQELVEHPNAAGWQIVNTEARVVRENFHDVEPGEVGELLLRGETLMKGYWNNPDATAAAMRDGWLLTGDLATVDEDGRVIMVDRKKDMIITGGMNVYSVEVEYALVTHPKVADCAVIGLPHPDYGETVTAVITPAATTDATSGITDASTSSDAASGITLEELREHCRPLIADYKLPRRLIIAPIPRNASGKVLKYQLREKYNQLG